MDAPIQVAKAQLVPVSRWRHRFFLAYLHRYVRRNFHAIRLAGGRPDVAPGTPLVVFLNHPSWWDPLVALLVAEAVFPGRFARAPIDAEMLRKYAFFEKIGFFGVERGSLQALRDFLDRGKQALAEPDSMLWITPQGRFVDVRERPVKLQRGLGTLVSSVDRVTALPLALEYPFWDESKPEALARFGAPLVLGRESGLDAEASTAALERALGETQDVLAREAMSRDPGKFSVLQRGSVGVGGVYDGWRRLKAAARGERFDPRHGSAS